MRTGPLYRRIWSGERRKLPITNTAPTPKQPAVLNSRRVGVPPWRWEFFAPARSDEPARRNPRRWSDRFVFSPAPPGIVYCQTGETPDCAIAAFCSGGGTSNPNDARSKAVPGGTPSATEDTFNIGVAEPDEVGIQIEITPTATTVWRGGTWTIRLNFTNTGGFSTATLDAVYICRVNSSCVSQATIASATGLGIDISDSAGTGVRTISLHGIPQTPSPGDKVQIVCLFNFGANDTAGVTWDQCIDTPFTVPTTPIPRHPAWKPKFYDQHFPWPPRRRVPPSVAAAAPTSQVITRRPAWKWAHFEPARADEPSRRNPRRMVPRTETAPKTSAIVRARPKYNWQLFQPPPVWRNPRRLVPRTESRAGHAIHIRHPAWQWALYKPAPIWRNPRRFVPITSTAPKTSAIFRARPKWQWEHFKPARSDEAARRNPRRFVPRTETGVGRVHSLYLRRPPYRAADFPRRWFPNPRRFVPRTETAPRLHSLHRRRPAWRATHFPRAWFPNARRFVPRTESRAGHALHLRKPPWQASHFRVRFYRRPRRFVPPAAPQANVQSLYKRRPGWYQEFFKKAGADEPARRNPRRFVPRTETKQPRAGGIVPRRLTTAQTISARWRHYDRRFLPNGIQIVSGEFPPPPPVPITETPEVGTAHWWLDYELGGFWPILYANRLMQPTVVLNLASEGSDDLSDVLIAFKDGYVRQLDRTAFNDDGEAFSSYVMYGPILVGASDGMEGIVESIDACLTDDSGDATWALRVAKNYEDVSSLTASVAASGTWSGGGLNATNRPRRRGTAFSMTVSNAETNDGWSVEEINVITSERGMRR